MKRFNLLSVAVIAVLMVFAVGCTTMYEGTGYEDTSRGRVYRQVPYGSDQVIVVERDPYTGRYYQVSPYGYYGSPYSSYGTPYGYGYPAYPRGGGGGYYRGGNSGGTYRPAPQQPQRQSQQPQQRGSETTNKAKDILRGN